MWDKTKRLICFLTQEDISVFFLLAYLNCKGVVGWKVSDRLSLLKSGGLCDLQPSQHSSFSYKLTEKDRFILPDTERAEGVTWSDVQRWKEPTVFNDVNVYVVINWLFCTGCISSMCIHWNQFYYQYDTIEFWCECFKLWF